MMNLNTPNITFSGKKERAMAKQLRKELKAERKAAKEQKRIKEENFESRREKFAKKAKRNEYLKSYGLLNTAPTAGIIGLSIFANPFFAFGFIPLAIVNGFKADIIDSENEMKGKGTRIKAKEAYQKEYDNFERLEKEAEKSLGPNKEDNNNTETIDLGEGSY